MFDNIDGRRIFKNVFLYYFFVCKTIAVRIYRVRFERLWDTVDKKWKQTLLYAVHLLLKSCDDFKNNIVNNIGELPIERNSNVNPF